MSPDRQEQEVNDHQCVCCVSDGWKSRWAESKHKSDYGQWKLSAGKFYGDAEADKGNHSVVIQTIDANILQMVSYHANVGKRVCI